MDFLIQKRENPRGFDLCPCQISSYPPFLLWCFQTCHASACKNCYKSLSSNQKCSYFNGNNRIFSTSTISALSAGWSPVDLQARHKSRIKPFVHHEQTCIRSFLQQRGTRKTHQNEKTTNQKITATENTWKSHRHFSAWFKQNVTWSSVRSEKGTQHVFQTLHDIVPHLSGESCSILYQFHFFFRSNRARHSKMPSAARHVWVRKIELHEKQILPALTPNTLFVDQSDFMALRSWLKVVGGGSGGGTAENKEHFFFPRARVTLNCSRPCGNCGNCGNWKRKIKPMKQNHQNRTKPHNPKQIITRSSTENHGITVQRSLRWSRCSYSRCNFFLCWKWCIMHQVDISHVGSDAKLTSTESRRLEASGWFQGPKLE